MSASTPASIRSTLPPKLLGVFEEEASVVHPFVEGLDRKSAQAKLRKAMAGVFEQQVGLPASVATALAKLALDVDPVDGPPPSIQDMVERCALQRTLVRAGYGPGLMPYFLSAGEAAYAAFAMREDALAQGGYIGRMAPVLPPVHSQDSSLDGIQPSDYFKDSLA